MRLRVGSGCQCQASFSAPGRCYLLQLRQQLPCVQSLHKSLPHCDAFAAAVDARKTALRLAHSVAANQELLSCARLCTCHLAAVYVDGRETARFAPRTTDPTNGWYSSGSGAAQAPFDKPFSIVL